MLANMCVESHLRTYSKTAEVAVVRDTAGPRHPTRVTGINRHINYAFLAHAVIPTEEVDAMRVPT
jgi:hypothetical protein